jgi:hypothetical protein
MVRTESVRRGCNSTSGNLIPERSGCCLSVAACSLVLLIGAACAGASGPGIGIKIGAQTLKDPVDLERTTRARLDLEISSPRLADGYLDLAFTLGGSSLGSLEDEYVDVIDGTTIEETYIDRFAVIDTRVAVRFYPLGNHSRIRPHIGAGVGYFWLLDNWEYDYEETYEVFPGTYHTIVDEDEGTDTLAKGLFPFITAGLTVPVGFHSEVMFEFQYDFEKKDSGFDLGGPIYMFGARFRF